MNNTKRLGTSVSLLACGVVGLLACVGDAPTGTPGSSSSGDATSSGNGGSSGTSGGSSSGDGTSSGNGGSSGTSGGSSSGASSGGEDAEAPVYVPSAEAYLKAGNTHAQANFGSAVALSADGLWLAVGSEGDDGTTGGVNPSNQTYTTNASGAVHIFHRNAEGAWEGPLYYLKADVPTADARFGTALAFSGDGGKLAVASVNKVYLFGRGAGGNYFASGSVTASNPGAGQLFGYSVALSADGLTLAVGAPGEKSGTGNPSDSSADFAGAVYTYSVGSPEATYVKAVNNRAGLRFGWSVGLSGDGQRLFVGAIGDASNSPTINGDHANTSLASAGAAYVLTRNGASWTHTTYIKPAVPRAGARFGERLAVTPNGLTLAITAPYETSNATGVNGDANDTTAPRAGAAYVFTFGSNWTQEAYVKASNTRSEAFFGSAVDVSNDGSKLVIGSTGETGASVGVNQDQASGDLIRAGAAYLYAKRSAGWEQAAYLKASNTKAEANFGSSVNVTNDSVVAVGSQSENGSGTGTSADPNSFGTNTAGAVYVFK